MSDDDRYTPTNRQEILPPLRPSGTSVPDVSQLPTGLFGTSLFARARYASEQKQFESYTRLVRAKNELLSALETQFDLAVSFARASGRASQLPTYRKIGESQAHLELGLIQEQLDALETRREAAERFSEAQKERRELDNLDFQEQKAVRKHRIDQANRAHVDFLNPPEPPAPPPPPKAPPTTADKIRAVGQDIDEIERAFADERQRMIDAAGGEANLSAETKRALTQFEVRKNNLLNEVLGALG